MNWDVVTKLSPLEIQVHWATAVLAFVFGLGALLLKKGSGPHKASGRIYVVLMVSTAIAAFFVRSGPPVTGMEYLSLKGMSWIHLFVPWTLLSVTLGVLAAKRGKIKSHRVHMVGSFLGALIIAGAFTFLPGRRMNLLFFGDSDYIRQLVERLTS